MSVSHAAVAAVDEPLSFWSSSWTSTITSILDRNSQTFYNQQSKNHTNESKAFEMWCLQSAHLKCHWQYYMPWLQWLLNTASIQCTSVHQVSADSDVNTIVYACTAAYATPCTCMCKVHRACVTHPIRSNNNESITRQYFSHTYFRFSSYTNGFYSMITYWARHS
jgi:hypothetical protein